MNKPVRFGVISASPMAESHMTAIRDNADAVLTAVCDIDLEKAQRAAAKFQLPPERVFADYVR